MGLLTEPFSNSSSLDLRLAIEASLFELEVKGDPSRALKMIEVLTFDETQEPELFLKTRLLQLRCFFALGEQDQALSCYRDIRDRSKGHPEWIEAVNPWIPDAFVVKEVPWNQGEVQMFERFESREAVSPNAVDLICTEITEGPGGETFWKVRGVELGQDFQEFEVILDRDSLQVRSTQLNSQPLYAIEKRWFGISPPLAKRSEMMVASSYSIAWMLRGLLLQQCEFNLGFERALNLYDIENGMTETAIVSVSSMELVTLPSGTRNPCWIADVDRTTGEQWEWYAFANDTSKTLMEFRSGEIRVSRRLIGRYEKVAVGSDGIEWCRMGLKPLASSNGSGPEAVYFEGRPGVRCYVGKALMLSSIADGGIEMQEVQITDALDQTLNLWRFVSTTSHEQIGWGMQDEATGAKLMAFGPENEWKHDPDPLLLELVQLLNERMPPEL